MAEKIAILIVDDDHGMRETLADIMIEQGFDVSTADSGERAIEMVREKSFRTVLMDIKMQGMDGVRAMKEIRKINPGIVVILMTAYAKDALVEEAYISGVKTVLRKPFSVEAMLKLLCEKKKKLRTIIVDDEEDFSKIIAGLLVRKEHQVVTVPSGEQAAVEVEKKSFDFALIDMNLNGMNGLDTFLMLKEKCPGMRCVLMTGFRQEMKDLIESAILNDAYTCLYKPFEMEELHRVIGEIFH